MPDIFHKVQARRGRVEFRLQYMNLPKQHTLPSGRFYPAIPHTLQDGRFFPAILHTLLDGRFSRHAGFIWRKETCVSVKRHTGYPMKAIIILLSIALVFLLCISYLFYKSQKELGTACKERDDAVEHRDSVMKELWLMRTHYINAYELYKWLGDRAEKSDSISSYETQYRIWGELESQKVRRWIAEEGRLKRGRKGADSFRVSGKGEI